MAQRKRVFGLSIEKLTSLMLSDEYKRTHFLMSRGRFCFTFVEIYFEIPNATQRTSLSVDNETS